MSDAWPDAFFKMLENLKSKKNVCSKRVAAQHVRLFLETNRTYEYECNCITILLCTWHPFISAHAK